MYCTRCGTKNSGKGLFCKKCGASLVKEALEEESLYSGDKKDNCQDSPSSKNINNRNIL